MPPELRLTASVAGECVNLVALGQWTAETAGDIERQLSATITPHKSARMVFDAKGITAFDTFGAWLVERLVRDSKAVGIDVEILGLAPQFKGLLGKLQRFTGPSAVGERLTFSVGQIFETVGRSSLDRLAN